jgi:4'-phosphopantetheinyl transferase EntD
VSLAALAKDDPGALAARLKGLLAGLGVPVEVGVAANGHDALASALAAAGRAVSEPARDPLGTSRERGKRASDLVAGWPCPYASLSHSGEVAVAVALPVGAFARGLGVDLELDRTVKRGLARLICDAREQAWIADLPEDLQATELLRLWTAKEALYKADPAQGDAIVAEYALAQPSAATTEGVRAGHADRARVVSIRIEDATISVACRAMEDER